MKSQRSRARVAAMLTEPESVQSPAGPMLVVPGEVSTQIEQNKSGQLSGAGRRTSEQVSHVRENAAKLLACVWKGAREQVLSAWKGLRAQQIGRSNTKRLHVVATTSLGEKRFVAVIQVDGREFLVGGGATNVELLAQLDEKKSFDGLLTETMAVPAAVTAKKQPVRRTRKKITAPVAKQVGEKE